MKRTWKSIVAIVLALALLAAPVMAEDNTKVLLGKIEALVSVIQTYYYKDVTAEQLLNGAIKGMFGVLDKHSTYFTPKEYQEFSTDLSGEFSGLGIYIEKKDDYIQVTAPIKGSPAERGGILPGDMIIQVDGKDIKGYSTEQAAAIMRGPAGTKVKVGVSRKGINGLTYFDLTREVIQINPVDYKLLPDNIGYISISTFNGKVLPNFTKALGEFKAKNVQGIIIDLRNNGGGLLDEAVEVCKLLMPKGTIVSIKYKTQPTETYSAELEKAPFKVMMLVNGGSASASEIMAAAIQDSGTGKLVGENTYGKGTVQTVLSLTDGSGMKVTVANYLTPKGKIIDGIGIKPDFEVKNTAMDAAKDFAPINGQRSVKMRTIGLDVLGVQQRLNSLGYKVSALDGIFGKGTLAAVQKFQKDNNLKTDGSMDPDDIKALNDKFDNLSGSQDAQLDKAVLELKKMLGK